MITMTFDLSSTCIGVTFAQIDKKKKIIYGETLPIIPKKPDGTDVGYTTKKPKKLESKGNTYTGYLKPGEVLISKAEADRRKRSFKNLEHNTLLRNIGIQCGRFLNKIKPDIVAIEKNKAGFNGILTTKLLAEIAGGIYFYCGAHAIEMYDWDEATVRSKLRKDIQHFSLNKKDSEQFSVDTKWEIYCRLRAYFNEYHPGVFNFEKMGMDESDSLAIFYYLYKEVISKKGEG